MATSGKFRDGLADIRERWSLDDVVGANQLLDAFDAAEQAAIKAATAAAKPGRS